MAKSPLLFCFYVETTREELKTRRGCRNEEEVTEFSLKDLDKIERKLYRCVFLDYLVGENHDFFKLKATRKMYLRDATDRGNNYVKYRCYKIYDIFSQETELAFRLYIDLKEKRVYDPDPEAYINKTLIHVDYSIYNEVSWDLVSTIYCLQKRNVNIFII